MLYARHIPVFWLPPHVAENEYTDVLDQVEASVHALAITALSGRSFKWRLDVHSEEPSKALSRTAEEAGSDAIIVVGRSGWSALHEIALGSVSNRLVRHTNRAVLLVD